MKNHFFPKSPLIYTLLLPFLITACFNPEPDDYGLALEAVDVVCVEATFRVTASGVPETWTCGLYRDDSLVVTETLSGQSGYIRDTGLLPAADYTYHITYMKEGRDKDRSDPVAVTTLDTTSHDFTWTVETLGDAWSTLNDVAIVDENNIWVVGYIKEGDSIYNAAHWDGEKWEMIRVLSGHTAVTGISYFSRDDIWVTLGVVAHWNGNEWVLYHLWDMGIIHYPEDGGVYQVWGSSSDNVWFAGNNGTLVHYDGSGFNRVQSDTELRLTEIAGNPATEELWATGFDDVKGSVLLRYIDHQFQTIVRIEENHPIPGSISNVFESLWIHNGLLYIASNGRVYISDYNRTGAIWENFWFDYFSSSGYPNRSSDIDGTAANNYFVVGHYGLAQHYNGISWVDFSQKFSAVSVNNKVRMKGNTTVICGYTNHFKGSLAIGRQN